MNFALLSDRPSTMKQSRERFILISSHNQERREENYQITGNQKNDSEALVGATPFMSRSWTSMEPRMESAIDEIERQQSAVGKFNLGLPLNAPNISASSILGIKPFRELLYTAQLKYLLRLFNQDSRRWSKDAFLDHLNGTWNSKYIKYMTDLRDEVGLKRWPRSIKEIKLSLEAHFLKRTNDEIDRLDLPALEPLAKRARMEFVNETKESQVDTPCMFLADSHIQVYQLC